MHDYFNTRGSLSGDMHAFSSSYAQVLNGLFENLHTVRFLDINFKKTSKMADRLAEADSMLKYVCLAGWA